MADAERATIGADGPYWQALMSKGELQLPQCDGCGHWHWPAVWRCGRCGTWDITWKPVALSGTVFSWTRTWHPFAGSEGMGVPFVSLIVELPQAGGRRVLGLLQGETDGLRIGAPVEGEVSTTAIGDDAIPALKWRLSGEVTA